MAFLIWDRNRCRLVRAVIYLSILVFTISGCMTTDDDFANDPFENFNRAVFKFNNQIDNTILEPTARFYADVVPEAFRIAITDTLRHLKLPVILVNSVLQGDVSGAGNALARFTTNTVVGFGGTVDTAAKTGLPFRDEDFGQTLGVWGMEEGPYLMVPVLGPMNVRDGIGKLGDSFIDPFGKFDESAFEWSHRVIDAVDTRSGLLDTLDELEKTSLDFYSAVRSLYRQKRNDEIRNGRDETLIPIVDIGLSDEEDDQQIIEQIQSRTASQFGEMKAAFVRQVSLTPAE